MTAKKTCFYLTIVMMSGAFSFGIVDTASSEPASSTPQDVFDGMRKSFQANVANGVHARYQWDLSGPDGGEWWIEVNDGAFKMGKGKVVNPDVTFRVSDKDWVALSNGTLGGVWAFLTGRLKVQGDRGLAKKLGQIFP
jgi:putative sterol carrier protein